MTWEKRCEAITVVSADGAALTATVNKERWPHATYRLGRFHSVPRTQEEYMA